MRSPRLQSATMAVVVARLQTFSIMVQVIFQKRAGLATQGLPGATTSSLSTRVITVPVIYGYRV
jgi:hypothetical protein